MKLDKREYEELKKIDIKNLIWQVREKLRERYSNYKFVDMISILYLTLIGKESKGIDRIQQEIEKKLEDQTTKDYLLNILSKDWSKIIEEIIEEYNIEELKAAILFSEPEIFSEKDMVSTPGGVSNLVIELLDIEKEDVVLDLGSGINSFLTQVNINTEAKELKGVELNTESLIIGNIRSQVLEININTIKGNMLSQDFAKINANKVFSNPPIGMNWGSIRDCVMENNNLSKYFENVKRTISGDWTYALSAYLNQNKPGKTIVIMSSAGTWNKPDEIIRKELLDKGLIEGVITLPENIFTFSSIDLVMMILSDGNKEVKMVDASSIFTKGRRVNTLELEDIEKIVSAYNNTTDISRLVDINEIKGQEYILNPKRFVGEKIKIKNGIKLGNIVKSINRGAMLTSKQLDTLISEEKTNYQYLMLQNINEGEIDKELSYLKELDENYDRYCIKNNNLVISKLSPFKIALVTTKEKQKLIANGNLYFLEIDEEKVNPIFLTNFLQGEKGIQQLNVYAKGAVMKSISIRDLKEIEIPNLPIEEQNKIGKALEELDEELIILQKQADIIRGKKVRLIQEVI